MQRRTGTSDEKLLSAFIGHDFGRRDRRCASPMANAPTDGRILAAIVRRSSSIGANGERRRIRLRHSPSSRIVSFGEGRSNGEATFGRLLLALRHRCQFSCSVGLSVLRDMKSFFGRQFDRTDQPGENNTSRADRSSTGWPGQPSHSVFRRAQLDRRSAGEQLKSRSSRQGSGNTSRDLSKPEGWIDQPIPPHTQKRKKTVFLLLFLGFRRPWH